MKKLALVVSLLALSTHAADNYECRFTVQKDGKAVGMIDLSQKNGESNGRLYTLPILQKKNFFGQVVHSVEVTLDGSLENGAQTDVMSQAETGIDATFTVVRNSVIHHRTATEKLKIATIKGRGYTEVTPIAGTEYTVTGSCEVQDGE